MISTAIMQDETDDTERYEQELSGLVWDNDDPRTEYDPAANAQCPLLPLMSGAPNTGAKRLG